VIVTVRPRRGAIDLHLQIDGLHAVLVVGAISVIQHVQRGRRPSRWLTEFLKRKLPKLTAVTLANKMARIAWKLMVTGENYVAKSALAGAR
jgi:transposase